MRRSSGSGKHVKAVLHNAPFPAPQQVGSVSLSTSPKSSAKLPVLRLTADSSKKFVAEDFSRSLLGHSKWKQAVPAPMMSITVPQLNTLVHTAIKQAEAEKSAGVIIDTKQLPDTVDVEREVAASSLLFSSVTEPSKKTQHALSTKEITERIATQAVLSTYSYDRLKTAPEGTEKKKAEKKEKLWVQLEGANEAARRTGNVIGECVCNARTLGNLRHDEGTTLFYRDYMDKELVKKKDHNISLVSHIEGLALKTNGLNLHYAVGKGAAHAPFLRVVEYVGKPSAKGSIALVGKGVAFDSGGLNVKPFGSMETMHMDMMGAAAVISTMQCVAKLRLPINVVGVVGFAENAIGPTSYHPSSIIRSLKGLTVEITNTDAEGRLILADALTYVQSKRCAVAKRPHTIIDLATLTGAIVAALGDRRAGIFTNDKTLLQDLLVSGARTDELLWPMPIGAEHGKEMKGTMSDLVNCTTKREGGACTAAAFLQNFIDKQVKWAHLDIAGPGMGTKKKGVLPDGAPGFGVQLLVDFLRRRSLEKQQ